MKTKAPVKPVSMLNRTASRRVAAAIALARDRDRVLRRQRRGAERVLGASRARRRCRRSRARRRRPGARTDRRAPRRSSPRRRPRARASACRAGGGGRLRNTAIRLEPDHVAGGDPAGGAAEVDDQRRLGDDALEVDLGVGGDHAGDVAAAAAPRRARPSSARARRPRRRAGRGRRPRRRALAAGGRSSAPGASRMSPTPAL